MPLVPTVLQSALASVFVPTMTDDTFSSGVASGINSFCGTGMITAALISGTVSAGTFTGSGTGSVVVNISDGDIKSVCDDMKSNPQEQSDGSWDPGLGEDDAYLAKELASIIDDAVTNGQFTVYITGNAVAGQVTTPFTMVPTTDITWTGDASTLETSLKASMISTMTDATFSQAIANAVTTYLTSAQIVVKGETALAGAQGTAVMA